VGCNIHVHGNNTKNLSVWLSQNSKNAMSFLLFFMFSIQQNQKTIGQNRFCLEAGTCGRGCGCWGDVAQAMYTHVSKCKNDKIKI
jgi:hypothetical protein